MWGFTENQIFKEGGGGVEEGFMRNQYIGELPKKGWLRQFAEKEGVVILRGVDTLMHTMASFFLKKKKEKFFASANFCCPKLAI